MAIDDGPVQTDNSVRENDGPQPPNDGLDPTFAPPLVEEDDDDTDQR